MEGGNRGAGGIIRVAADTMGALVSDGLGRMDATLPGAVWMTVEQSGSLRRTGPNFKTAPSSCGDGSHVIESCMVGDRRSGGSCSGIGRAIRPVECRPRTAAPGCIGTTHRLSDQADEIVRNCPLHTGHYAAPSPGCRSSITQKWTKTATVTQNTCIARVSSSQ